MTDPGTNPPRVLDEWQLAQLNKRRLLLSLALWIALLSSFYMFWVVIRGSELHEYAMVFVVTAWVPFYAVRTFVWKCPACHKGLGNKMKASHCRSCGVAFSATSFESPESEG